MTQYKINAQDSETSSQYASIRRAELSDQSWNRALSAILATNEGLELIDQHWHVIRYLREQYLEHGLPQFARTTARALSKQFAAQGGSKYLHNLFPGGPVTQGSHLANLRTPANATDISFGTSY
jgi:tRNA 2-thiouridine synthesizing protein E